MSFCLHVSSSSTDESHAGRSLFAAAHVAGRAGNFITSSIHMPGRTDALYVAAWQQSTQKAGTWPQHPQLSNTNTACAGQLRGAVQQVATAKQAGGLAAPVSIENANQSSASCAPFHWALLSMAHIQQNKHLPNKVHIRNKLYTLSALPGSALLRPGNPRMEFIPAQSFVHTQRCLQECSHQGRHYQQERCEHRPVSCRDVKAKVWVFLHATLGCH